MIHEYMAQPGGLRRPLRGAGIMKVRAAQEKSDHAGLTQANRPPRNPMRFGARRVCFHYTPKHASWLNMAEIEIGVLTRQCLNRRLPSQQLLRREVDAWQADRNALHRTIEWKFTRQDADHKLGRHYVSKLMC
ncbi:MAG: hypothetical protein EOP24_06665 [Hyphomicrobiales bacterium]|nr:MAG: hypothetical protein EOP24_06665 [Hyphomicrobiales bacterium]